jgi:hypothetical protein
MLPTAAVIRELKIRTTSGGIPEDNTEHPLASASHPVVVL